MKKKLKSTNSQYATKGDIKEVKAEIHELAGMMNRGFNTMIDSIAELNNKMEKGFADSQQRIDTLERGGEVRPS